MNTDLSTHPNLMQNLKGETMNTQSISHKSLFILLASALLAGTLILAGLAQVTGAGRSLADTQIDSTPRVHSAPLAGFNGPAALEGYKHPAALEGYKSPAALEGKHLPAALEGRYYPAALEGKFSPAALDGRYTPAALDGRTSPSATNAFNQAVALDGYRHPSPQDGAAASQSATLALVDGLILMALAVLLLVPTRQANPVRS